MASVLDPSNSTNSSVLGGLGRDEFLKLAGFHYGGDEDTGNVWSDPSGHRVRGNGDPEYDPLGAFYAQNYHAPGEAYGSLGYANIPTTDYNDGNMPAENDITSNVVRRPDGSTFYRFGDLSSLDNSWAPQDLKNKVVKDPVYGNLLSSEDALRLGRSAPKEDALGAFLTNMPLLMGGAFTGAALGGAFPGVDLASGASLEAGQTGLVGNVFGNNESWGVNQRPGYGSVLDSEDAATGVGMKEAATTAGVTLPNNASIAQALVDRFGVPADVVQGMSPSNLATLGKALLSTGALSGAGGSGGSGSSLIPGVPNNVLGQLLASGAGYMGSKNLAEALQKIADQGRADRAPALNAFNTALSNPDAYYKSAPAMGATDAILRKLSVNGNPSMNPGDLSKAAAYGLDKYNDWLKTLAGPAFGGEATNAQLATTAATAAQNPLNALGYGANALLNPQTNILDLLNMSKGTQGGIPTPTTNQNVAQRDDEQFASIDPAYDDQRIDYSSL